MTFDHIVMWEPDPPRSRLTDQHGHEYDADLLDIINDYHNK